MPRLFAARPRVPAPDGMSWPHVVIIGGGFAGANAALELKDARVRVTLIDRNIYKTFQPLLYQVATGGLNPGDVTMVLRGLSRHAPNLRVRQGDVVGIDPQRRTVTVEEGGAPQEIAFDHLIAANGITTNYFGTPGAEAHAMPMYGRQDATAVRDRIFAELERSTRSDPDDFLHVSIVGGGATGVEIAGALADFRRDELSVMYPELDERVLQIRILQRGKDILKQIDDQQLRDYAADELRDRGVQLVLGQGVKDVGYDFVVLADDTVLESDITIWAAGTSPDERVSAWGLPLTERGAIAVDETLQVKGMPGVYAAGDIAGHDDPLPQLAQPAIQTGVHAARMIRAELEGRPRSPFRYRDLGEAATIGRRAAIVIAPGGVRITGTAGWFAWLGIHIMKLMGGRNRRAVTMNLVSLYAARQSHQPNPVTGNVDSLRAAEVFRELAGQRKFGPGHRA
ncbi:NAD(P)/FAD-dependent oxidoreductase [Kocuria palustris]|uniref:NAD(P)/FAD-dependent oxidoreductase n=1 Tax=Kocuria palustris TaxID=71999 RepID=UPI0011A57AC1|nr:NAD(P)/FAD-dependent oxidoreductase [Kocuria palustris]